MSTSRLPLALFGASAIAVGCASPSPPAVSPAPLPQVASAPAPADPATPEKEPELPTPPRRAAPPPIDEALPPLTRTFTTVTIAGVKAPFIAVGGSSPREVLFLTEESHPQKRGWSQVGTGILYRTDGARSLERIQPCESYSNNNITAAPGEIVLAASNMYFRGVPGGLWAYLSTGSSGEKGKGKRSWSCGDTFGHGAAVSSGGRVWRYSCRVGPCQLEAAGLPAVRLPALRDSEGEKPEIGAVAAFWMRSAEDGWMAHAEGDGRYTLLRYNGVSWSKRASLDDLEPMEMWVDEADQVWILARRKVKGEPEKNEANAVMRFDGRELTELRLPRDFAARWLRAGGAADLWFLGAGRAVYQWDGLRLRRGEAPFVPTDAWAAPQGQVWIIGDGKPGSAAHTAPPPGGGRPR